MDYYGKRLATCSSDRTIKIFDVEGGNGAAETLIGYISIINIKIISLNYNYYEIIIIIKMVKQSEVDLNN